jgi:hypothetical protein
MRERKHPLSEWVVMCSPWAVVLMSWLFVVLRVPMDVGDLLFFLAMLCGGALAGQMLIGWGLGWFSNRAVLPGTALGILIAADSWHVLSSSPGRPVFWIRVIVWLLILASIGYMTRVQRQEREHSASPT